MRIDVAPRDKFVLRTAGIFLRDKFWALPGGGCEFFEDTKESLVREMKEELNASIHVKQLAVSVENFFQWNDKRAHENGFYYLTEFIEASSYLYKLPEFFGIEEKMEGFDKFRLHFKWFPLSSLSSENIKPDF